MVLIKTANDSLREIFIQRVRVYAHTLQSHTHRDLQSHFGREQSSKGLNVNKQWSKKPHKVLIVESFEGDDKKAQYANFKHIFI